MPYAAASERRLFEDLKTGCGLRCSECKTGPSCTSGKPKIHCCWNPFGPKPKDGTCSDARSDKNNCGACGTKCGPAQTCCTGVCKVRSPVLRMGEGDPMAADTSADTQWLTLEMCPCRT
jgi:hypothetical protein